MNRDPLHWDLESRSAADLTKVGGHRYWEDPTSRILLNSYRFGKGPTKRWFGELPPQEVIDHVAAGGPIKGHNQSFERSGWNSRIAPLTGVRIKPEQQDCTLARAASAGLPKSLGNLGEALGLSVQKDKEGHALMMKMCKPKAKRKGQGAHDHEWHEEPADVQRLAAYCDRDVETECAADAALPPLPERERRLWILDQKINDRGFAVDTLLAGRADLVVREAKRRADAEMARITGDAITSTSQAKRLQLWLAQRGIPCTSVADGEVDELLVCCDLISDKVAAEALQLRRNSAGAFKFEAMLRAVCADGRVRGCLQYHGTHGGRWAGRVVQPQNFKRVAEEDETDVARMFDLLRRYDNPVTVVDAWQMLSDRPVLEVLTLCARGMIIAKPGHKLVDADFSNIEGRLAAWFAGETWKIRAFEAYDAGTGPDLYKVTASVVTGVPIELITKTQRQEEGKVPELACLGPDTLVFTNNGLKRITDVELTDKLWDGVEWVTHSGLVYRGQRKTISLLGVEMTPDHLVLVGDVWREAQTVVSCPAYQSLALATCGASLRSPDLRAARSAAYGTFSSAAVAAHPSIRSTSATYEPAEAPLVRDVRDRRAAVGSSSSGPTPTYVPTTRTGAGCSTEFQRASTAATIPTTEAIPTTAAGVYAFTNPGAQIAGHFSRIWSRWPGGTKRRWRWTGATSTKVTSQATSGSSPARSTQETDARSKSCNDGSPDWKPVFDIAHAGPRNRFAICSHEGLLIVHNCGYQGGRNAFRKMAAKFGLYLSDARIDVIVRGWRATNSNIVAAWAELQNGAIEAMSHPGMVVPCLGGKVQYLKPKDQDVLWCLLPSGRVISYAKPQVGWKTKVVTEDGDMLVSHKQIDEAVAAGKSLDEWSTFGITFLGEKNGRLRRLDLYGGMQFAHVVSGTARDLLVDAMFAVEAAGYALVLTIHDELLAEVPLGFGSADLFKAIITAAKALWAKGLPLVSAAWEDVRYVK